MKFLKTVTPRKWYLFLHIALISAILLFPLYRKATDFLSQYAIGCLLHDRFFLYCPFCGGTRAAEAVLRLDFVDAFRCNALAVCMLFFALSLDVYAFVRFCKGENPFFRIPAWGWILLGSVILSFGIVRNILLIRYLYDPLGDLLPFWTVVRG